MAGVLTDAAGPLSSGSSGETGVLTASEYGLVSSPTIDQTTLLQAFIDDTTAKIKLLDVQVIKITSALTLPAAGTRLMGFGSGGDFTTYLVPTDCAAFNLSNVHHSLLENFMIWPQGATPPATIITVQNGTYSVTLRAIRIHMASSYVPSTAVILQHTTNATPNLDILYDQVKVRTDGTYFPVGYQFGAACGQATLTGCDIEACGVGIKHLGGKITVIAPYTERFGVNGISLEASTDADSSFTMHGGQLGADASAVAIAVRDGAKNVSIQGTWVSKPANGYQGFLYGLSGSSNIDINPANYDATKWGTAGASPASTITVGRGDNMTPPAKFTSINVTTGTLAAGAITGAQFVSLMSTNATPGNQATRTAAQMIADHGKGPVDASYILRITNTGAGTFTMTAGSNVTLTGTMTVAQNTWREFVVTMGASTVTIQSIGVGTYS